MRVVDKIRPRQVVAFLLAPLAPGFVLMIIALFGHPGEGIWGFKFLAIFTYPAMLVLGLPAHLLLVKRHWTSGWSYTLAGLVIGAVVAGIFFGGRVAVLGALLGAVTGFTFWLIAAPSPSRRVS